MRKIVWSVAAGLVAVALQLPAAACDPARGGDVARAGSPVVAQAVERVRSEQREQIERSARVALAQLRSEAATALAQGATSGTSAAVKAAP